MYLNIYNPDNNQDYEIVRDSIRRDWMDDSVENHAYKCHPVSSMNTHSWSIILKKRTIVHWSSNNYDHKDLEVLSGPGEFNMHGGFVSFQLPFIFETEKDIYTIFYPNPNRIYENATPLSFLIRSDWFPTTFQCVWKLHRPGRLIIEEGTPLISFMPYPKKMIDETNISVYNKDSVDKSIINNRDSYNDYVESEYNKIDQTSYSKYPYVYKKGNFSNDYEKVVENPSWRPRPAEPIII